MTNEEAIAIIRNEYKCVDRDCDIERSCGKCDLMMPSKEPILEAYKLAIKALEQQPCDKCVYSTKDGYCQYDDIAEIIPTEQKPCEDAISREFVELVVEYPPADLCTYPEYKGKPYYSIKYYENGEEFVGYGTYKPEVLSRYLKEYFMPSVTQKYGKWIEHPEIETSAPEYLMFYECSECGDKQCFCKSDIHKKRFCNNCGAKMVEPQESEKDACKDCYYNDGEVHAECVICDKAESEN